MSTNETVVFWQWAAGIAVTVTGFVMVGMVTVFKWILNRKAKEDAEREITVDGKLEIVHDRVSKTVKITDSKFAEHDRRMRHTEDMTARLDERLTAQGKSVDRIEQGVSASNQTLAKILTKLNTGG